MHAAALLSTGPSESEPSRPQASLLQSSDAPQRSIFANSNGEKAQCAHRVISRAALKLHAVACIHELHHALPLLCSLLGGMPFLPCSCCLSYPTHSVHCSIPAAYTRPWRTRRTRGSSGTQQERVAGQRHGMEPAKPPPAMRLAPPGVHSGPRRRSSHSESTLSVRSAFQTSASDKEASDADLCRSRAHICSLASLHKVCDYLQMEWQHCAAAEPGLDAGSACDGARLRPRVPPLPRRLGIKHTTVRCAKLIGADACAIKCSW